MMTLPNRAASVLVFAITFLVFSPALNYEFLNWDDDHLIQQNPQIQRLDAEGVVSMFTSYCVGNYTPLERLSCAVDWRVWGMNPWGFHFTNILLHSLNAVLVYFLALRIFLRAFEIPSSTSIRWAAACAALAFALHPLRVESVVWISERRDVLSLFFLLLCALCHWTSVTSSDSARQSLCRMGAWLLFMASLLSKASGVTLPMVLLALDFYPLRRFTLSRDGLRDAMRCAWEKAPFFFLSIVFGLLAIQGQVGRGTMAGLDAYPWPSRVANTFSSLVFYIGKWLLPFHLSPIYPEASHHVSLVELLPLLCTLWVVLVTSCVVLFARRRPALLAVWWCYGVMILPFTGLLQAGAQGAADRYTCMAMIPFAILLGAGLVWACRRGIRSRVACGALMAAMLGGWIVRTEQQMCVWKDSPTFWEFVLRENPYGFNPLNGYGLYLMSHEKYHMASVMLRDLTRSRPAWELGWHNYGMVQGLLGRDDQAIAALHEALARRPWFGESHFALANVLMRKSSYAAAQHHYFMAMQDGMSADRYINLAIALQGTNQGAMAIKYLQKAADLGDPAAFHVWVGVLDSQARTADALEVLHRGYRRTRDPALKEQYTARVRTTPKLSSKERDEMLRKIEE